MTARTRWVPGTFALAVACAVVVVVGTVGIGVARADDVPSRSHVVLSSDEGSSGSATGSAGLDAQPADGAAQRITVTVPAVALERSAVVRDGTLSTHVLLTTGSGSAVVIVRGVEGCSAPLSPAVVTTLECPLPGAAHEVTLVATLSDGRRLVQTLPVENR